MGVIVDSEYELIATLIVKMTVDKIANNNNINEIHTIYLTI